MGTEKFKLTFLGAAGTVTGSKTLIDTPGLRLLVDCGLFQGLKELRLLNRAPLPVEPASIELVLLTHAHLDHVGYLPLLVKNGFSGKIYATPPTCDLAKIILTDSARLQEEEAHLANRGGYTKHQPAEPLYTLKDANRAISMFVPIEDESWTTLSEKVRFKFIRSGHILGSAFIKLEIEKTSILFSGDLGRPEPILVLPPKKIEEADYLVLESTYGNRLHPQTPTHAELSLLVNKALLKKGNLIIPTFAVERAQEIMFLINTLKEKNMIPRHIPVYLDSPMGISATEVMMKYPSWHQLENSFCEKIMKDVAMVREINETQGIIDKPPPRIIIAGSGMLSGGRILEYLKAFVEKKETTILFVGYQAVGTRGRAMLSGAGTIKIHGRFYQVKAELVEFSSFSGHADQQETLQWLDAFGTKPKKIFLNHGEPESLSALSAIIQKQTGIPCVIPKREEAFEF